MALFKRATDILSANLHDLLDRFENPERMLRQAIREIEQACETAMDAAAKAIAQERLLARRSESLQAEVARWQSRATSALSRSDDEAARSALREKLRRQELADLCEEQQRAAAGEAARLRNELFQLRSRLNEARHLMDVHVARSRMTTARRAVTGSTLTRSGGQSAFGRFQRICETIDREETESQAMQELCDDDGWGNVSEFDMRIELELEALKAETAAAAETA